MKNVKQVGRKSRCQQVPVRKTVGDDHHGADEPCLSPKDIARADCRLHITTLWLPCLEWFAHITIPAIVACFFLPLGTVLFFIAVLGLLPTATYHILRFFTFKYRLTPTEITYRSGLIFRSERRIPFDRIQEVEIHRSPLQRLLKVARVDITTAGSDAQEASLVVVSNDEARHIQNTIGAVQRAARIVDEIVAKKEVAHICNLSVLDLVVGGLTSRLVASLGAVVGAVAYFQAFVGFGRAWWGKAEQDLDERIAGRWPGEGGVTKLIEHVESMMPDLGPFNFVADLIFNETLPKSLLLVLLGLIASVVGYVIRYYSFRLSRMGDILVSSYGLLSERHGNLARDRIQTLKIEEGLLRRIFQLAAVRVDSAGDRGEISESKKRDVLVPVASKKVTEFVAMQAMPGLKTIDPKWQRTSPRSVLRGSKKGWLLILLAMLQTWGIAAWFSLLWLPAFPLVYFLNQRWFVNTGYWLDDEHFLSRRGWLNRETTCLSIRNVQNASVVQSYFDRRLGLATLAVDTAGQSNTGGGPVIHHLPLQEAKRIQTLLVETAARYDFD